MTFHTPSFGREKRLLIYPFQVLLSVLFTMVVKIDCQHNAHTILLFQSSSSLIIRALNLQYSLVISDKTVKKLVHSNLRYKMESSKSTDQLVLFEASPATAGNRAWPLFHRKKLFLNQPMIICRENKFSIDKRDYWSPFQHELLFSFF